MAVIQLMPTDYLTSVSQEQKWEERCGGGVGAVSELDELFFFCLLKAGEIWLQSPKCVNGAFNETLHCKAVPCPLNESEDA